jgi:hypothetical protein
VVVSKEAVVFLSTLHWSARRFSEAVAFHSKRFGHRFREISQYDVISRRRVISVVGL